MKKKFESIKDRQRFYFELSKETAVNPKTIECNWFLKTGLHVPTSYEEMTIKTLDKCIEFEKIVEKLELKHFGQ